MHVTTGVVIVKDVVCRVLVSVLALHGLALAQEGVVGTVVCLTERLVRLLRAATVAVVQVVCVVARVELFVIVVVIYSAGRVVTGHLFLLRPLRCLCRIFESEHGLGRHKTSLQLLHK